MRSKQSRDRLESLKLGLLRIILGDLIPGAMTRCLKLNDHLEANQDSLKEVCGVPSNGGSEVMTISLNVYGTFTPGPWRDPAAIIDATVKSNWSPATEQLKAFASSASSGSAQVEQVVNCYNMLCAIIRHKPDRLNIFTHANDKYLYLCGRVVPGDVIFNTLKEENRIDSQMLAYAEDNNVVFSDGLSKNKTFQELRDAIPSTFEIGVFACHVALSYDIMKGIANFFNCQIRAFREEVRYYPYLEKDKLKLKYGISSSPPVESYQALERFFQAPMVPDSKLKKKLK